MTDAELHVVLDHDRWKVEQQEQGPSHHATQEEAVKAAYAQADVARPAEVFVHDRDGKVEERTVFEDSPLPESG